MRNELLADELDVVDAARLFEQQASLRGEQRKVLDGQDDRLLVAVVDVLVIDPCRTQVLCPAWVYHQHVNDGDEQAIIMTVQDFPLMAAQRSLLFEEPRGVDNIKLVSKKFVPHRDTADSFKLDV